MACLVDTLHMQLVIICLFRSNLVGKCHDVQCQNQPISLKAAALCDVSKISQNVAAMQADTAFMV